MFHDYILANYIDILLASAKAIVYILIGIILAALYKKLVRKILRISKENQRNATIGNAVKNIGKVVIWFLVIISILESFGVKTAPILASAGIIGLAFGLGAQKLVNDFISGFF